MRYEIAVYTHAGALERLIRRPHTPARVTSEDIALYKDERLKTAVNEQHRRSLEREFSEVPFPDVLPPYARLQADEAGNLWLQDYPRPGDEQHRWSVFGPDSRLVAMVLTPSGLRVLQIGDDFLLGQIRDEDDVEHIVVYQLDKTQQQSSKRGGGAAREK